MVERQGLQVSSMSDCEWTWDKEDSVGFHPYQALSSLVEGTTCGVGWPEPRAGLEACSVGRPPNVQGSLGSVPSTMQIGRGVMHWQSQYLGGRGRRIRRSNYVVSQRLAWTTCHSRLPGPMQPITPTPFGPLDTHTCMANTHGCTQIQGTHIQTYVHIYIHTCMHARMHAHTYMPTYLRIPRQGWWMAQQLRALPALAEDLGQLPAPTSGSSQVPVTPASGNQIPSGFCGHTHE